MARQIADILGGRLFQVQHLTLGRHCQGEQALSIPVKKIPVIYIYPVDPDLCKQTHSHKFVSRGVCSWCIGYISTSTGKEDDIKTFGLFINDCLLVEYCGSNESIFFVNDGVELKSVRDATRFVGLLKNSKLEKKMEKNSKRAIIIICTVLHWLMIIWMQWILNITISKQLEIFAAGVNSKLSTYITIQCV